MVDSHPAIRLGLKGLLGVAGDAQVVSESGDGDEALGLVEELRLDLVILGLDLAGETDSYLHKRARCQELLEALRRTAVSSRIWGLGGKARELCSGVRAVLRNARLTPKKCEVLVLMICYCSNAEIAGELYSILATLKTHMSGVLRRLGVRSRRELSRRYRSKAHPDRHWEPTLPETIRSPSCSRGYR